MCWAGGEEEGGGVKKGTKDADDGRWAGRIRETAHGHGHRLSL